MKLKEVVAEEEEKEGEFLDFLEALKIAGSPRGSLRHKLTKQSAKSNLKKRLKAKVRTSLLDWRKSKDVDASEEMEKVTRSLHQMERAKEDKSADIQDSSEVEMEEKED